MNTGMAKSPKSSKKDLIKTLVESNYLFRGLDETWFAEQLPNQALTLEKLYSNRLVYTAFDSNQWLDCLYAIVSGGPIIIRSSPLDRIITINYAGGCFGMRNLPLSYGLVHHAFPSQVEAYKTTDVIKIPLEIVKHLYQENEEFRCKYHLLFELREKFQYHLLNCSAYPPQSVAALLRALIYQERALGNQPDGEGIYIFDLPIDIIARACQLNHRTVEQVLKGMQKVGLLEPAKATDASEDVIRVIDAEGLKETYSATRDKVSWWPLR